MGSTANIYLGSKILAFPLHIKSTSTPDSEQLVLYISTSPAYIPLTLTKPRIFCIMSRRFPPISATDAPEHLRSQVINTEQFVDAAFGPSGELFQNRDEYNNLIGPFPFLIASGPTGQAIIDLLKSFAQFSDLSPAAREVAIFVVGARFGPGYQNYAHTAITVKKKLLTQEQVDIIKGGQKPDSLSEDCNVAYTTAHYLVHQHGPLPRNLYEDCLKTLGKNATLGLIHFVGIYCYSSVMLNAADEPVPEG